MPVSRQFEVGLPASDVLNVPSGRANIINASSDVDDSIIDISSDVDDGIIDVSSDVEESKESLAG